MNTPAFATGQRAFSFTPFVPMQDDKTAYSIMALQDNVSTATQNVSLENAEEATA